jgi:hypothetical protein
MKYVLLTLFTITALFLSPPVFGGENCSQLGGICRNACRQSEQAQYGAFEDCGETQECCAAHDTSRDEIRCCISSFETQQYGAINCVLPQNNHCSKGSGSPDPCENLIFCKDKK